MLNNVEEQLVAPVHGLRSLRLLYLAAMMPPIESTSCNSLHLQGRASTLAALKTSYLAAMFMNQLDVLGMLDPKCHTTFKP